MARSCMASAALAVGAVAQQLNCLQDFPALGVTYDLSTMPPIIMSDNRNNSLSVFSYVFGVCSNIDPTDPSYTNTLQGCQTTYNDDGSGSKTGPAPAFQVGVGFPSCKRLGDNAANGQFFLDVSRDQKYRSHAASGIQLYYQNGDSCIDPFNSSNLIPRSTILDFQCYDQPIINDKGVVLEDVRCGYHAIIPTRYGCPKQCPFTRGRLCSANGICGYDVAGGYAKCFCNQGFSGSDCTTVGDKGLPPPTNYAPQIAGGVFGGILGGCVLAVAAFIGKAMMGGLTWRDGLELDFAHFGTASKVAPGGTYTAAAAGPMFTGAGNGYEAPQEGYAPPDDGPLIA